MTALALKLPASPSLTAKYTPLSGTRDEMLASDGVMREHWQALAGALDGLGPNELARRMDKARRLIHENGLHYNIFANVSGATRPWDLDPLPLVLAASEWHELEAGLSQRARLLDLILADIYGLQTLLHEGLIPPELIYATPEFLRPCFGVHPPGGRWLHFYGADLARAADGRWSVVADWPQNVAGVGYALENRIVLSRTLPDAFRDCQVMRLAPFFRTFRETLVNLAPRHKENPRIVLLTPGPQDRLYFEHAYLARYLGFTLVEGDDLTVRDAEVFLKTLAGLLPVDVIHNCVPDTRVDPLELDNASADGVPGLLQALRRGSVAVANALGVGAVQSAALMTLLPELCKHLLGENLLLPCRATWWCGNPAGLEYVLAHMDELVISSCSPMVPLDATLGGLLSVPSRQALALRIRAQPYAFVGQEPVSASSTPMFTGERLRPRRVVVRAYLAASPAGFTLMPGGLARVGEGEHDVPGLFNYTRHCKDAWVMSSGPVTPITLLTPPSSTVGLLRAGDLPSRVADNLYWLGRYVERAEGMVRLMRAIINRLTDESRFGEHSELPVLVRAVYPADPEPARETKREQPREHTNGRANLAEIEQHVAQLLFDETNVDSLKGMLVRVRRAAAIVRDRISIDAWRILHRLDSGLQRPTATSMTPMSDILAQLDDMVITLSAFSGLGTESMTRGQGWRFQDLGRRLERAMYMVRLIKRTMVDVADDERPVLQALLEVADSSMTYRSRYLSVMHPPAVLDLLLTDDSNPRSLLFQLNRLIDHVEHLPKESRHARGSPEQRLVLRMQSDVRLSDVDALCVEDRDTRPALAALLQILEDSLPMFSDMLTSSYLTHAADPRLLTTARPE